MAEVKQGGCFCGAVQVEVTGDPALQGYCHCEDCRRWSGTPVTAYALWPGNNVRITKGSEVLGSFVRTEGTIRKHCTDCGGSVMTENEPLGMIDVYPVLLDGFNFKPTMHIRYGSRVIDMPDGLPKYRDMPAGAGGSDELIQD